MLRSLSLDPNGRNCLLFFVFVGNAEPKMEMEDKEFLMMGSLMKRMGVVSQLWRIKHFVFIRLVGLICWFVIILSLFSLF